MPESDDLTAEALRSSERLVVVEAPAGCGKTWQGATYAADAAKDTGRGRVLVLAHTHAATDVFVRRTPRLRDRVEVRTIHSLVFEIAKAYHRSLDLPSEPAVWARAQADDGFDTVTKRVAELLDRAPMIEAMLADRFPVVICDEHQDASDGQHRLAMALLRAGAKLRIFGDPMQKLYAGKVGKKRLLADQQCWNDLVGSGKTTKLRHPHRWKDAPALGEWILHAREMLEAGNAIDLTHDLPPEVQILRAENAGQGQQYRLDAKERKPVDAFVRNDAGLLILCAHNPTVQCVRSTFGRSFPIWEGHTREPLDALAAAVGRNEGDAVALSDAVFGFLDRVTTGFTPKGHGDPLRAEISGGCSATRKGFLAGIQRLGRRLLAEPNHRGVASLFSDLADLIAHDSHFEGIHVDYPTEFQEAIALGAYETPDDGLAEITSRRTMARPMPPRKAISTVHKAKGLEQENVLIIPCDAQRFSASVPARHKFYVALSRATKRLTLVVPAKDPSPLLRV